MSSLGGTLGILQVAGHLIFFLFGTLTIQTYVYYYAFPSDVLMCKLLVRYSYAGFDYVLC